jgi:hypothetical protein
MMIAFFIFIDFFVLGTIQPLNAFFRPHPSEDKNNPNPNRKMWEFCHKGIGYFAVLGGMVNCIIAGFVLESNYVGTVWVEIVYIFCAISFLGLALYAAAKSSVKSSHHGGDGNDGNSMANSVAGNVPPPPPKSFNGIQMSNMPKYNASFGATPSDSSTSNNLPPGWVERISSGSGEIYYYHAESGESSWELPTGSTAPTNVAVAMTTESTEGLPDGWSTNISSSGEKYYVKPNGDTTWELPEGI